MLLKIFTVYDSKTEAYLPPFFLRSTGEACRSFEEACNDPNHPFYKHSPDYTLFELGVFDDNACTIDSYTALKSLGLAIEFKRQAELPLENKDGPFELPLNSNSGDSHAR